MPTIIIDDQKLDIPEGYTILQAAEMLGIEIPVFCYHPKLSIAGNCRMCLVEVENNPKPVASCAMPVSEGMVVHTKTKKVQYARQGVLEFLLINHPLDCPICDQGGECDLQDVVMAYGGDASRYHLNKRAVPDKNFGPLIQTHMNRCIHCMRCVRFSNEIVGIQELGAFGRGEETEIATSIQNTITSELSGNMIDICPVGALTSKPYAFRGRSWELNSSYSVDVFDAVGSAIRIDTHGREVMRILPRLNDDVNEEWISDKVRFSYDGLKYQRLDRPYLRNKKGNLVPISWDEAMGIAAEKLGNTAPDRLAAIVGNMVDAEAMVVLKDIMINLLSHHIDCRSDNEEALLKLPCHYLFNSSIKGIEDADFCLLIGTNPRWEAPLINARLRKSYLQNGLDIAVLGNEFDLGYPYQSLGNDPRILTDILKGTHPLGHKLNQAKKPILIIGQSALQLPDSDTILAILTQIAEKYGFIQLGLKNYWNGFNVLQTAASRVAGHYLGFIPQNEGYSTKQILEAAADGRLDTVYLLGADEIDTSLLENVFVIYQGHHGDKGATGADLVLPGAAFSEKSGTYVNTEGRIQRTFKACLPPGEAQEDWRILREIAERLNLPLCYTEIEDVRKRMVSINPLFESFDVLHRHPWQALSVEGDISSTAFKNTISNYYMTDVISRNSPTMAKCAQEISPLRKQHDG